MNENESSNSKTSAASSSEPNHDLQADILRKKLEHERAELERNQEALKFALERSRRSSSTVQFVTAAALGMSVVFTLTNSYTQIAEENIGVLDWLRSATPIRLTATIGSLALVLTVGVASLYSYLAASQAARRKLYFDAAWRASLAKTHSGSITATQPQTPAKAASTATQASQELTSRATEPSSLEHIRNQYRATQDRLNGEIEDLNKRAFLNLSIGSIVTLFAALVLVYVAVSDPPQETPSPTHALTFLQMATHYLPRISIVIFLEVFAFFFLRLYKSTLADIRLYQIDLTKVCTQAAAVELVFVSSSGSERAATAMAMINAECSGQNSALERMSASFDPKLVGELASIVAKMANKTD
ncbi:hypothetical protein ACM9XD_20375 [Xanthomonas sacchari]